MTMLDLPMPPARLGRSPNWTSAKPVSLGALPYPAPPPAAGLEAVKGMCRGLSDGDLMALRKWISCA